MNELKIEKEDKEETNDLKTRSISRIKNQYNITSWIFEMWYSTRYLQGIRNPWAEVSCCPHWINKIDLNELIKISCRNYKKEGEKTSEYKIQSCIILYLFVKGCVKCTKCWCLDDPILISWCRNGSKR